MAEKIFFERASIIGVGLIGGSIARALKNHKLAGAIVGAGRTQKNLQTALDLGIIDQAAPPEESVKNADIVFLCGPVLSIIPTLEKIAPFVKEGAIVTDAGSSKAEITGRAEKIAGKKFHFVGSHPIAGTEKSGAAASSNTLFENNKCIITPTQKTDNDAREKVEKLWRAIGMDTVIMDAKTHDEIFSAVSHLPHMVVYALVNAVSDLNEDGDLIKFMAGGFKDFTRIASSPPEMWADVALSNSEFVSKHIGMVKEQLEKIESAIKAGDKKRLMEIFEKSTEFRKKLL